MKLKIKKRNSCEQTSASTQIDSEQTIILNALANGESLDFDELCDKTNIAPSKLSSELIKLEMFGLIKKGEGNTYFKI